MSDDTILIMSNGSKWKPATSSDIVHCVHCDNAVDTPAEVASYPDGNCPDCGRIVDRRRATQHLYNRDCPRSDLRRSLMQQYETITMPDAGIGSFLTSNMDEIDDNVLMFGHGGGINSMHEVADRMAKMGREGDTFVVHASEKEVMVPREVAENNPQLLAQIKDAIAAEGADPEAYVVGSDRNSINPMTGQREFFLKKLVKGIKKVFKKAAKDNIVPVAIKLLFYRVLERLRQVPLERVLAA